MTDDQVTSPEDCLRHCRHSLTQQQYEMAIPLIQLYGVNRLRDFLSGGWVEGEAVKQNLDDVGRIGMIIHEGLCFLCEWLDKEPAVPERAGLIAMTIADEARRHYKVPLALALGHLIAEADEETLAAALATGRSIREERREERKRSLRLVQKADFP